MKQVRYPASDAATASAIARGRLLRSAAGAGDHVPYLPDGTRTRSLDGQYDPWVSRSCSSESASGVTISHSSGDLRASSSAARHACSASSRSSSPNSRI